MASLQAGCANAPANAESATPPKANTTTAVQTPFPELKLGMTAEVVRAKLGDPVEIRPMESKIGKAEVWVFHIERTVDTTQVVTGTKDTPAFALRTNNTLTTTIDPVYSMADKKAETIAYLLMVNGRLFAQTASPTKEHLEYK